MSAGQKDMLEGLGFTGLRGRMIVILTSLVAATVLTLGMAVVLLGCALTVGAATALAVPIIFALIIQYRFIYAEEKMLTELFPEDYPVYCAQVRRWI